MIKITPEWKVEEFCVETVFFHDKFRVSINLSCENDPFLLASYAQRHNLPHDKPIEKGEVVWTAWIRVEYDRSLLNVLQLAYNYVESEMLSKDLILSDAIVLSETALYNMMKMLDLKTDRISIEVPNWKK